MPANPESAVPEIHDTGVTPPELPDPIEAYERYKESRRVSLSGFTERSLCARVGTVCRLQQLVENYRVVSLEAPYVRLRGRHSVRVRGRHSESENQAWFCETTCLGDVSDRVYFNFQQMYDMDFAG